MRESRFEFFLAGVAVAVIAIIAVQVLGPATPRLVVNCYANGGGGGGAGQSVNK